ncbi:uncharacterized protein isoform X2 [Rhodnius prolixus]|uniref:uncharacterized protein isoform X2 n=1 Tax=Rhodnius prolixus TaxID=13249 RepID=UPI003D1897DB
MIQITLRPLEGTSPSEERIQRPERPQRANRPGNTSPLQSYIIRSHTGHSAGGREELPRPNAPAHDENYNNRSISPLFASQSTSLTTDSYYSSQRVAPASQISSSAPPCDSHPSGSQVIDVEYSESQSAASPNNPDYRIHPNAGFSTPAYHHIHNIGREDQQDHTRHRNWSERRVTNQSRSNSSDRLEDQGQTGGSLPGTPRRFTTERSFPQRISRSGNVRDNQESSVASRNSFSLTSQWGERRNRLSRLAGVNSIGNYIPFSTHSIRQNWEMWNGIGGLPRRPIRREPRQDPNVEPMAIPPLINLVEGEDDAAENYMPQDMRINMNVNRTAQLGDTQIPERISTWEEELPSPDDNVNVIEDEESSEEGIVEPVVEEDNEDNEVLLSVPSEERRIATETAPLRQSSNDTAPPSSRNVDVRQLVLSALECPVCFDYVSSPMVQCYEGHLVCNKCRIRLNHCPECRGPFSTIRPRAVEKIASFLEYPCSYEGCIHLVSPSNWIMHAKSCSFRNFVCPIAPTVCTWSGQRLELRNHVLNFHGRHPHWIQGTKLSFIIQPHVGREQVFVMDALDQYFLVKFVVAPQDKLRGCVTLLGYDASRAENMNVIVLVQSTERPSPCLMVSRSPAEENDEMDMRLEKFAVFNISQLIQSQTSVPNSISVKIALDKKDILRRLNRMFD